MAADEPDHGAYVRRVREDTQRYASELLHENERLRLSLVAAEQERRRLEQEARAARLEAEQLREREGGLRAALARVESENRSFGARFLEVEQENSNLANLYVASYRLHGSVERAEVLEIIQEIVVNLVGCEELAVYELPEGAAALELLASNGIDPREHARVALGQGEVGRSAASGETFVAEDGRAADGRPSACIPLRLGERVTGAIVLFRLLPQKASLGPMDRELFDLLATHAATALYCSGLQARLAREAA